MSEIQHNPTIRTRRLVWLNLSDLTGRCALCGQPSVMYAIDGTRSVEACGPECAAQLEERTAGSDGAR